jgi:hypothetical protein
MRYKLFYIIILLALFLSACSNTSATDVAQAPEADEPTSLPDTETPLPTLTATDASTDTPAPSPTNTATYTFTPTMLPTQFMGFESANIFKALAYMDETLFYFIVPYVASPYYGTVDGYDMVCEPDPEQENLLTCRAEEDLFGTDMKYFEFYADEARTYLVYAGEFSTTLDKLPPTPVPVGLIWPRADYTAADITWGQNPPGCTERGVNLQCETEYRKYSDGSCLVGMTCWDTCGYYYSVNTIKDKQGDWIPSGPCY